MRTSSSTVPGYVVGAYAASRAHASWNEAEEERLFALLEADPRVGALELPWIDGLHPHDEAWLLRHYPRRFGAVLTSIPGLMRRLARDPAFGLASTDGAGRTAAVAEALRMRDAARRFADAQGRAVVRVVELHAGPRADRGSSSALARSLDELAREEWDGVALVIEHCDAAVSAQPVEKGFLSLEAELAALADAPAEWGVSLNWGRSAIELRNPDAVVEHARLATATGRLRGVMLSGTAAVATPFGPAWADAHLPFRRGDEHPHGEPLSLLTDDRAAAFVEAAPGAEWWGVKVGCADDGAALATRMAIVGEALSSLERARVAQGIRG